MNIEIQLILPGDVTPEKLRDAVARANLNSLSPLPHKTSYDIWKSPHHGDSRISVISMKRCNGDNERFFVQQWVNKDLRLLSLFPYQAEIRSPRKSVTTVSVHTHLSNDKDRMRILEYVASHMNGFIVVPRGSHKKV